MANGFDRTMGASLAEYGRLAGEKQKLERDLKTANNDLKTKAELLARLEEINRQLEAERNTAVQQAQTLQSENQTLRAEAETLDEKHKKELAEAISQLEMQQQTITEAQLANTLLRAQIDNLESQASDDSALVDTLRKNLEVAEKRVETLVNSSEEYKKQIEEFPTKTLPGIYELLEKYNDRNITVFKSRQEADIYLKTL